MKRIAVVKKEKCNPVKCGDYLCVRLCPVNRMEKECIRKVNNKIEIDELLCTGCNICSNRCPFKAISIVNLPEELKQEPIIRFGKNGFALYKLPIPKEGQVVGVLGRNGIGKTTAIRVLSGELKSDKDLVEFFKGTELQNYFEKLKKGEIRVSVKPQKVDEIPRVYKGNVLSLLKSVDEKGILNEVIGELDLGGVLNRQLNELSGGELQRVAIAAAAVKDANIYFFDEPSSYLDIKQRLRVANFIRKLTENASVLVIEHDLIILDYMTDLVHIMYGKDGCYGVVSQPKTTRNGINSYLEGYLKEENIRFRDKKINFRDHADVSKAGSLLANWNDMDVETGDFKLKVNKGLINKNEVVGILGENGIGKTSFVKLLKDEVKLKVAYKPQYLEGNSEELVGSVIAREQNEYKGQILKSLELTGLMDRRVKELSGGELQRLSIALTLMKDSELILMDEPSAFLDVEQRLNSARIINEIVRLRGISAFVVDHDLLFADYLSDRLMVFLGRPAIEGITNGPFSMEKGMNLLLSKLRITLRREENFGRPRINKEDSVKDKEQKKKGNYYYS